MNELKIDNAKAEWLEKVQTNADPLRAFLAEWHPANRQGRQSDMPTTAPAAEEACELFRGTIAAESTDPVAEFDRALAAGDCGTIYSLLNGAWFGVPESTSCWRIPGFAEAVDLLGDPPFSEEECGE